MIYRDKKLSVELDRYGHIHIRDLRNEARIKVRPARELGRMEIHVESGMSVSTQLGAKLQVYGQRIYRGKSTKNSRLD